jgi:hypothetical protein
LVVVSDVLKSDFSEYPTLIKACGVWAAGLPLKLQNSSISTDTELDTPIEMQINSFFKINGIKKTGLNQTGFLFF